jgi:hypothetical protein
MRANRLTMRIPGWRPMGGREPWGTQKSWETAGRKSYEANRKTNIRVNRERSSLSLPYFGGLK